jgi:hypothetical protein
MHSTSVRVPYLNLIHVSVNSFINGICLNDYSHARDLSIMHLFSSFVFIFVSDYEVNKVKKNIPKASEYSMSEKYIKCDHDHPLSF